MRVYCHFCETGQVNTYLVCSGERNCSALIIDPADLDNELIRIIESHNLTIKALLVTHNHENHVRAAGKFQKIYPCPVYAYSRTISGISTVQLKETLKMNIEGFTADVLHVPGHSDDSLVYVIENAIFSGDTLQAGRVSSTSSFSKRADLIRNISKKILCYDDNYLLFPAHGCPSKIRIERMMNYDMLETSVALSESLL